MKELKSAIKSIILFSFVLLLGCLSAWITAYISWNVTVFYWITVASALLFYYNERIADRGNLKRVLMGCTLLILFFMLLKAIRYELFLISPDQKRFVWYLYYIPIIAIPTLTLFAAFYVDSLQRQKSSIVQYSVMLISALLIIAVLTNDYHELVFSFDEALPKTDNNYHYGALYYVIAIWIGVLSFLSLLIMIKKCRLSAAKRHWWVMTLPYIITIPLLILNITERLPKANGNTLLMIPDLIVYMMSSFIQCGFSLGLIPVNKSFRKIIECTTLPIQLVNEKGLVKYRSKTAKQLCKDELHRNTDTFFDENNLLHKLPVSGGYGFWQEDISELNRISRRLSDIYEQLSQEGELIRLDNELKQKQLSLLQRTALYDKVAEETVTEANEINRLVDEAVESPSLYTRNILKICILGAFIKRYSNLSLTGEQLKSISLAELWLSIAETLKYISKTGIICNYQCSAVNRQLETKTALCVFMQLKNIIVYSYSRLNALYVTAEVKENVIIKAVMEGDIAEIPSYVYKALCENGIGISVSREDTVLYVRFEISNTKEAQSG